MISDFPLKVRGQLDYWQRVLGLSDWDISLQIVCTDCMDAYAETYGVAETKTATIRIWDPSFKCHDAEATLVHELLHIHLLGLETQAGTQERFVEEQAVEAIAKTLTRLKRGKI